MIVREVSVLANLCSYYSIGKNNKTMFNCVILTFILNILKSIYDKRIFDKC